MSKQAKTTTKRHGYVKTTKNHNKEAWSYRKHEEEDAVVPEVVLRNPGSVTKFAQKVEADKPAKKQM